MFKASCTTSNQDYNERIYEILSDFLIIEKQFEPTKLKKSLLSALSVTIIRNSIEDAS